MVVKGGLPGKAVVVATGEKPGGQDFELSVDFVLCLSWMARATASWTHSWSSLSLFGSMTCGIDSQEQPL